MPTLMEIITRARKLLPDFAEADEKVRRGEIAPAEHPAARIMGELQAKAKAEGKSHYAFLGRLIPVDRAATVEQILSEFPQGEMEEAGRAGVAMAHERMAKPLRTLSREGMEDLLRDRVPKTIAQEAAQKGLATTKSALAPKDELQQLLKLGVGKKSRDVVQTYEGVLEREARMRFEMARKAMKVLRSKPVKMAVGSAGVKSSRNEEY